MSKTPSLRVDVIDSLRGWCLFAVCMINLWSFSGFRQRLEGGLVNGIESWFYLAQSVWLDGKAYPIFAMLFGMGCGWLMTQGALFWWRRMAFLMALGVLHLVFIWYGDILFVYACLGLLLWPMRDWRGSRLLLTGVILLSSKVWILAPLSIFIGEQHGAVEATQLGFSSPQFLQIFQFNWQKLAFKWQYYVYLSRPAELLAMAMLGLWVQRHLNPVLIFCKKHWLRCWLLGSLLSMLVVYGQQSVAEFPPGINLALLRGLHLPIPLLLAMGSLGALVHFAKTHKILLASRHIGRMGLSVYILQSLMAVGFFYGPFLNMHGQLTLVEVSLFAVVTFSLQGGLAWLWLRHFRHGPLEWLWRRGSGH